MGQIALSNAVQLRTIIREATPEGDCLIWEGAKDSAGYGMIRLPDEPKNSRVQSFLGMTEVVSHKKYLDRLHRMIYKWVKSPTHTLDRDCYVIQTCGNKACVNPEHIVEISRREHHRQVARKYLNDKPDIDATRKLNRTENKAYGLHEKLIKQIGEAYYESDEKKRMSVREAAAYFNVSATTIQKIWTGRAHGAITGIPEGAGQTRKLTDDDVRYIRSQKGEKTMMQLTLEYYDKKIELNPQTISNIWTRRTHRGVK